MSDELSQASRSNVTGFDIESEVAPRRRPQIASKGVLVEIFDFLILTFSESTLHNVSIKY